MSSFKYTPSAHENLGGILRQKLFLNKGELSGFDEAFWINRAVSCFSDPSEAQSSTTICLNHFYQILLVPVQTL